MLVLGAFRPCRSSRRDHSDDSRTGANCVVNHQHAVGKAAAKEYKAWFGFGMIGVIDQASVIIVEHGHRLPERHAVFPEVRRRLAFIPPKPQPRHGGIITTL